MPIKVVWGRPGSLWLRTAQNELLSSSLMVSTPSIFSFTPDILNSYSTLPFKFSKGPENDLKKTPIINNENKEQLCINCQCLYESYMKHRETQQIEKRPPMFFVLCLPNQAFTQLLASSSQTSKLIYLKFLKGIKGSCMPSWLNWDSLNLASKAFVVWCPPISLFHLSPVIHMQPVYRQLKELPVYLIFPGLPPSSKPVLSNAVAISHMWLLNTWNRVSSNWSGDHVHQIFKIWYEIKNIECFIYNLKYWLLVKWQYLDVLN